MNFFEGKDSIRKLEDFWAKKAQEPKDTYRNKKSFAMREVLRWDELFTGARIFLREKRKFSNKKNEKKFWALQVLHRN